MPPTGIDPTAKLGRDVVLGQNTAVGPAAEIGDRVRIGAGSMIGAGVTLGHDCEIGDAVVIAHAHIGDRVVIRSNAQVGAGASAPPGRIIIQDRAWIGMACVIEQGVSGDTVIGDGTRIADGARIGRGAQIGRRCVLADDVEPGSAILDFTGAYGQDSGGNPAKPI